MLAEDARFADAVDGALSPEAARALDADLAGDPALAARFAAYRGAVARVRALPRERAPAALQVALRRRTRRRRWGRWSEVEPGLVPAEAVLPLLLAALAALLHLILS